MKSPFKTKEQRLLPGLEQALCACGCGEYFLRVTRGRKRLYVNDTHKKRVMRAKRKERASETRVRLTPKGIAKAAELAGRDYVPVWDMLTPDEQWTLHLAKTHPNGWDAFWLSIMVFVNMRDDMIDEMRAEFEAEYEDN